MNKINKITDEKKRMPPFGNKILASVMKISLLHLFLSISWGVYG